MARIRGGNNGNNTYNLNLGDRVTDRGGDDDTFHFNEISSGNPNTGRGFTIINGFSVNDQIDLSDWAISDVSIQDVGGRNPHQIITVDMST
jgi:hypothetical protein